MSKTDKEYSDVCFTCGIGKSNIEYSQKVGDPIYCVTGSYGEYGFEADQEYDRHRFVRTLKQKLAEEADERAAAEFWDDAYRNDAVVSDLESSGSVGASDVTNPPKPDYFTNTNRGEEVDTP